ncbi:MAG: type IV pilus twitching motility protein PilT [Armatimonadaceae bacterium]
MYSTIYTQTSQPAIANNTPLTISAQAQINQILIDAVNAGASDIHISAGLPPMIRQDGTLHPAGTTLLSPDEAKQLVEALLATDQKSRMHRTKDADFTYIIDDFGRFRVNAYQQRGTFAAAIRPIPAHIPSIESLRLPPILSDLTRCHAGLILVTGATGSGKSTTIAAMVDHINRERAVHILTLEDPIEYTFQNRRAMVNQREIGTDSADFQSAMRSALREDPDVIVVGELRDLETMRAALTLAETGHLVFATLHTRSAPSTVDRFIDAFPAEQQNQVRTQLAGSLQAVISQQLIRKVSGGRIAGIEILTATAAVRSLIREGKTHQLANAIETGAEAGMISMDRVLSDLVKQGFISNSDALERAIDRDSLQRYLRVQNVYSQSSKAA